MRLHIADYCASSIENRGAIELLDPDSVAEYFSDPENWTQQPEEREQQGAVKLLPGSDPEERLIPVNAEDDGEEQPDNKIYATAEEAGHMLHVEVTSSAAARLIGGCP